MRGDELASLAAFYRNQLLGDVIPFWEARTRDVEHGGYFTCFDREGNLTGSDKNLWCQGRMVWMFSAIWNRVEKRSTWLDLARCGRDFIVRHGYAGDGRWHYLLSRSGSVVKSDRSFFTDAFVLSGLAEYALASGSEEDRELISCTFDQIERNFQDPDFNEFHHFTLDTRYQWHSVFMIALFVCAVIAPLIGEERTARIVDLCLYRILHVFAKDEHRALFEAVGREGSRIDDPPGRRINPGHIMESMWFCMEEARRRGDRRIIERCITIIDWAYEKGHDSRFGGLFNILDCSGGEPGGFDAAKSFGESWDDKVWWVHSEALYALLLAAVESGRQDLFDRFLDLHRYCQRCFHDPEFGEWYAYLHRDGRPKVTDKGTWIKAAFHVPRNLMQIMLLLEREKASPLIGTSA